MKRLLRQILWEGGLTLLVKELGITYESHAILPCFHAIGQSLILEVKPLDAWAFRITVHKWITDGSPREWAIVDVPSAKGY